MAMVFIMLIGQPILVGYIAQKHFKQIGVLWAIISFALMCLIIFMVDSGNQNNPRWHVDPEWRAWATSDFQMGVTATLSAMISAAVTLAVVWTLPKKA